MRNKKFLLRIGIILVLILFSLSFIVAERPNIIISVKNISLFNNNLGFINSTLNLTTANFTSDYIWNGSDRFSIGTDLNATSSGGGDNASWNESRASQVYMNFSSHNVSQYNYEEGLFHLQDSWLTTFITDLFDGTLFRNWFNQELNTTSNVRFANATFTENVTIFGILYGGSPLMIYGGINISMGDLFLNSGYIHNGSDRFTLGDLNTTGAGSSIDYNLTLNQELNKTINYYLTNANASYLTTYNATYHSFTENVSRNYTLNAFNNWGTWWFNQTANVDVKWLFNQTLNIVDLITSLFKADFKTSFDSNLSQAIPTCSGTDKLTSADGQTFTCSADETGAGSGTVFTGYNYTTRLLITTNITAYNQTVMSLTFPSNKQIEGECFWMENSSATTVGVQYNITFLNTGGYTQGQLEEFTSTTAKLGTPFQQNTLNCTTLRSPTSDLVTVSGNTLNFMLNTSVMTATMQISVKAEVAGNVRVYQGGWCRYIAV